MTKAIKIRKVAVIGAGTLGAQIAMVASKSGYDVTVSDPNAGQFDTTIDKLYADYKEKGLNPSILPLDKWAETRQQVRQVQKNEDAAGDADLVVEAVPENLELKRSIFKQLGQIAPAEAILTTNSSSIPVSHLEESSGRPERVLNTHFYMVLEGMNMADLMGGSKTLPEVMDTGADWIRSMGCLPLTVKKELMGFCFNRVWRAVKRETLYMWGNDFVDLRDVDRAWMIAFGHHGGAGPFASMDHVGLDVVWDIEMSYYNDSKDPKDHPPKALKQKIDKGELGVKSGKGFYTYPDPEYLQDDFLKPKANG